MNVYNYNVNVWLVTPPTSCLLEGACSLHSITEDPHNHQNAATNQLCCPQCEQANAACQHSCQHACILSLHMLFIYLPRKWEWNCQYLPSETRPSQTVIFTWQQQYVCLQALLSQFLSLITAPHTIKSTNTQVHIQELRKEGRSNPGSPWEQMSPAQTSDRLPQPAARLKVLCRAEGGHYCWPSCTGGNIEGGVKRLQGSTQRSHTLLCWPFSSAKMQQVTFELKPLTEFFLFFVTCSRSTVCHLVVEAWNNTNSELRGEILQIGEKMTSLTHAVNASESCRTETESAHADPVQAHSEWTPLIISLLQ